MTVFQHQQRHGAMKFGMQMCVAFCVGLLAATVTNADEALPWKAAAGSVVITPKASMWMAGYAARDKPSEGVAQDLFAKVLVLEDAEKTRLAIVTLDLIGI